MKYRRVITLGFAGLGVLFCFALPNIHESGALTTHILAAVVVVVALGIDMAGKARG